jgi:hypothetical protein
MVSSAKHRVQFAVLLMFHYIVIDSIFIDATEVVDARRGMQARNKPMDPDVYAKKVLDKIVQSNHPAPVIFEGGRHQWFRFLYYFVPRSIVDWYITRLFGLDSYANRLVRH